MPDQICEWSKSTVKSPFRSKYCTCKAGEELRDLVNKINAKWIITSYNNNFASKNTRVKNKIGYDEMMDILSTRGETIVDEIPYKPYNAGKTMITDNKELLFITKVR